MSVKFTTKSAFLIFCSLCSIISSSDIENDSENSSQNLKTDKLTLVHDEKNPSENPIVNSNSYANNSFMNNYNQSLRNFNENDETSFKNVFLGMYKNYQNSYLTNKTLSEYKDVLNRKLVTILSKNLGKPSTSLSAFELMLNSSKFSDDLSNRINFDSEISTSKPSRKQKSKKKKKRQQTNSNEGNTYNVGPGVDVSLDTKKNIVDVKLDENCLREILLGNWNDDSEEGRGKKYGMLSKTIPLFIIPFLIQSAIIPFLVTSLKLLLIKSIMVGKLAILLLVISAIKNNQKVSTYEPMPAYWSADPMRRSEIINGYRAEGRPISYVN